jgi:glutathione S-transferase
MLLLYNAPQSTCSQKVRLCLHEKKLEFDEKKLDLFCGDQLKADYLALNPNGVVPTLVDDGEVIVDSSVIMEYLEERFPEARLSPGSAIGRAHMREWLRFFEEVPTPAVRVPSYNLVFLRHFKSMSDEEFLAFGESKPLRKDFFLKMGRTGYSDDEMRQAEGRLQMTVDRVERALDDGRSWLLGDYSLADICVMPVMMRVDDIGMSRLWGDRENVAAWFSRFRQRAALRSTFYFGSLLSEQYPDVDFK